jgi:hypothetical protein
VDTHTQVRLVFQKGEFWLLDRVVRHYDRHTFTRTHAYIYTNKYKHKCTFEHTHRHAHTFTHI